MLSRTNNKTVQTIYYYSVIYLFIFTLFHIYSFTQHAVSNTLDRILSDMSIPIPQRPLKILNSIDCYEATNCGSKTSSHQTRHCHNSAGFARATPIRHEDCAYLRGNVPRTFLILSLFPISIFF